MSSFIIVASRYKYQQHGRSSSTILFQFENLLFISFSWNMIRDDEASYIPIEGYPIFLYSIKWARLVGLECTWWVLLDAARYEEGIAGRVLLLDAIQKFLASSLCCSSCRNRLDNLLLLKKKMIMFWKKRKSNAYPMNSLNIYYNKRCGVVITIRNYSKTIK